MNTRMTLAWTLSALVIVAGLAFLVSVPGQSNGRAEPTGGGGNLTEAVEDWDFTGFSGNLSFTSKDASWVDIALPVTNGTDRNTLTFSVNFTWEEAGEGDRTDRFACWTVSPRFDGEIGASGETLSYSCSSGRVLDGDGALEVNAEVHGEGVAVDAPHPAWLVESTCDELDGCSGMFRKEWSYHSARLPDVYDELVEDGEREIVHWRFFTGAFPPDRTEVYVRWEDTVVNVTSGGEEDTFWYFREDFSHDLYARADTLPWTGVSAEEGAEMETELLEDSDRPVFFFYEPWPSGADGWGDAGYERPDGSSWTNSIGTAEVTNMTGTWRFWYPENQQGDNNSRTDFPVLWGMEFDWAEMPWGES